MTKKLLACDIDDVMAKNAEGFTRWSNEEFGTSLTADDYTEDFTVLWPGIDSAEIERRASLFHETGGVLSYDRIEEAEVSLRALAVSYRLVAVTSRRRVGERHTQLWMNDFYRGLFEDIVFAGIYDEPTASKRHMRTKAEAYKFLKPGYVIDDQNKHCLAAAEQGIPAILYGQYSWNTEGLTHPLVTRCMDWPAVVRFFDEQAA
jgi:hypothetical protein